MTEKNEKTFKQHVEGVKVLVHSLISATAIIEFVEGVTYNKVTERSAKWHMTNDYDHYIIDILEPIELSNVEIIEFQMGVCDVFIKERKFNG